MEHDDIAISVSDSLVNTIAVTVVKIYKKEILEEIKGCIKEQINTQLSSIKREAREEIVYEIKRGTDFDAIKKMKSEVKSQLKKEHNEIVKNLVTERLATIVAADIRNAAKKYFSNELFQEYKYEMMLYFVNDLKKHLKTTTPNIIICPIESKPIPAANKPVELKLMKHVFELNIKENRLSAPSGIYFLYKGDVLQYIGQSICVIDRVNNHIKDKEKDFDSAYFIPVEIDQLNHVETFLINHLNPVLNKHRGNNIRLINKIPDNVYEMKPAI